MKPKAVSYDNSWEAVADTPEEAANLRVRADSMHAITAIIKERGWTQADAASHCGVTQPRINDLLHGRISRFSLDALLSIASASALPPPIPTFPRKRGKEQILVQMSYCDCHSGSG